VVTRDAEGQLIGALVAGALSFEADKVVLLVRHLVVEPSWRGRGVGVVQLGVLPQVLGRQPDLVIGNCEQDAAGFYQRAGFTVLEPGVPLPFPFGRQPMVQLTNEHYPCWFFRTY
jgi:GNAT superfamily N-acetyltransferase